MIADVRVHLWKIESMEEEEEEELKHRGLENMVRDGWTAGRSPKKILSNLSFL